MAATTTNYGLTKPLLTDFYDINVQNANMDIIDEQLKAVSDAANGEVTSERIAHGAVGTDQISADSITSEKVLNGSLTGSDLAEGTIVASRIANKNVTKEKLAPSALAWSVVTNNITLGTDGTAIIPSQAGKSEMLIVIRSSIGVAVSTAVLPLNSGGIMSPNKISMVAAGELQDTDSRQFEQASATEIKFTDSAIQAEGGSTAMNKLYVYSR